MPNNWLSGQLGLQLPPQPNARTPIVGDPRFRGGLAPPPGVPIGEIPGMVGPGGRRPLPPGGAMPPNKNPFAEGGQGKNPFAEGGQGGQPPQPMPQLSMPARYYDHNANGGRGGWIGEEPPRPAPPPPGSLLPHQEQAQKTREWEDMLRGRGIR